MPGARRAVVVGGGLLGLQVARALGVRGLATEVVEGGEHLLRSQVDAQAGAILARDLRRLGTTVYTGARAVRLDDARPGPRQRLHPRDRPGRADRRRPARRPRWPAAPGSTYAAASSSTTACAPATRAIHAIGDCAAARRPGHRLRAAGLGAGRAAGPRTSPARTSTYDGARTVARLRATGLDVAVLGDPERAEGEVVEVSNPVAGSHRKLVVRDGVIVAATLVGDLSRIGLITQHYDRGTVLGPGRARRPADGRPADRRRSRSPTTPRSAPAPASPPGGSGPAPRSTRSAPPPAPPPAAAAAPPAVRQLLATPPDPPWKEPPNEPPPPQDPGRRRPRHGRPPLRPGRDRARPDRDPRHRRGRRGAARRPTTGSRSPRSSRSAPRSCPSCPRGSTTTRGSGCCSAPRSRASTRRRRPCCSADGGEVLGLRRAGAGHRRGAVRAADARPRPARLLRLPHDRGPRGDPRGREDRDGSAP